MSASRLRIEPGQRLLFIGDSITDTEYRTRAAPLGYGYVMMFHAFLDSSRPGLNLEVLNRGNDGDTIADLAGRWQRDVIENEPDWVFVMIGTNDVGNRFVPGRVHLAVDDQAFDATLQELITRTRAHTRARTVFVEPPIFDLPLAAEPNRAVARLCERIAATTARLACERVAVRAEMARAMQDGHTAGWFQNVNHPHFTGHAFIAQRVLLHVGWSPLAGRDCFQAPGTGPG
jgi:lysophospholipase L1-like esterase